MADFLSRFIDCLIFEDTETFFPFDEEEEEGENSCNNSNKSYNLILETWKPISNYSTSLTTYQKNYISHLSGNIQSLPIGNSYSDYKPIFENIETNSRSLQSQLNNIDAFFEQVLNKTQNKENIQLFLDRCTDHLADVKRRIEFLIDQFDVLERKCRWDLLLVNAKLKDSSHKPVSVNGLKSIDKIKHLLRETKISIFVEKMRRHFEFSGLKQLVADDTLRQSASSGRVLHRLVAILLWIGPIY